MMTLLIDTAKNILFIKVSFKVDDLSDEECFIARANLVHEYRKFLFIDPFLPKELLPERWSGNHAALLFNQYYKMLAEPASRFFEEVFQEENDIGKKDKDYDSEESTLMSGIGEQYH